MTPRRLGRYELVRPLGEGGTSEVWEAVRHGPGDLRQGVAIKLLRGAEPAHRDALVREARLGALLTHPNVVVAHDLGEIDGMLYVAVELVRGVPLSQVARRGPLPPAAVLDVGRQVCAGLAAIHALGATPLRTWGNAEDTWGNTFEGDGEGLAIPGGLVVHRDIKPDTLLVDAAGTVRIADLGLARATRTAGRRGGTHGYMPPEQLHGLEDTRADIFALGATLAELALGRPLLPKDGGDLALIEALVELDPSPLERTVSGLGDVVRHCLALDPDDRWRSVAALSRALETLQPAPEPTLLAWVAPWVPAPEPRPALADIGNLPADDDGFVGRRLALTHLGRLLAEPGLITVVGPAGVGKSRLALEAARAAAAGSRWWVDLGPARSMDGLCYAVARALGLTLGGEPPVPQLGRAIAALPDPLVVLDGVDAVRGPVVEALERWSRLGPAVRFVCTSRRALDLDQARLLEIGPLPRADAVALYERRAGRPVDGVEALVEALERLPLALEIAAAGGGRLTGSGVGAVLDAAWARLDDTARAALTQLTVFDGGFTLHAAEAVLALEQGARWALDRIDALVRAQLVRRDPVHPDRFRLLAPVRAWAADRLGAEDRIAAEERHARFFAQLGADDALRAFEACRVAPDLDNLVAAWQRPGRPARRAALAMAIGHLLRRVGPAARGEAIVAEALALPELTAPDTVRLLRLRADLLRVLGRTEAAREAWVEALTLSRSLDARQEAASRVGLGTLFAQQGRSREARPHLAAALALAPNHDALRARALVALSTCERLEGRLDDARRLAEEALCLGQRLEDRHLEAQAHLTLGNAFVPAGAPDEARRSYQAALHAWDSLGDRDSAVSALVSLGALARQQGQVEQARQLYQGALDRLRRLGTRSRQSPVRLDLADLEEAQDELDAALEHARAALAIAEETDDDRNAAILRGSLATLELEAGRPESALRLLQRALPELVRVDELALVGVMQGVVGLSFAQLGRLDEGREWFARARRLLEGSGDVARTCDLLCREARLELLAGDRERALALQRQAEDRAARAGLGPQSPVGVALRRLRALTAP